MKALVVPALFAIAAFTAIAADSARGAEPVQSAFRIRADFTAALNIDGGWAGRLNENVTIEADRPFRLRFEVESGSELSGGSSYRLQYRRNQGEWIGLEAHDFPHPQAEMKLDFASQDVGATPEGWTAIQGKAEDMAIIMDGRNKALRVQAKNQSFIGLYTPPWESVDFTVETGMRLPAENGVGVALVFGYVDSGNHHRVVLDVAAGAVRVSRFVDGKEISLAEKKAAIPSDEWFELEIELVDGQLAVNFRNEDPALTVRLDGDLPPSQPGFYVPAQLAADFREMEITGRSRTPRVSIVACAAYENGAATTDLLTGSSKAWQTGAGVSLSPRTPSWEGAGRHSEFEWALVVRRFADGAVTNDDGDTFEFRMVGAGGTPVKADVKPELRLAIPPGHVGGTFVETPGRIGPWQASNGDLYFIMEPTETDNLFLMIKSTDAGRTWREVDGANRPRTGDLEAVDGRLIGDTIHLIHQVTRSIQYHTFHTSDHPTEPDAWGIRDERGAAADSVAQGATLAVRSDQSVVAFYVGETIHARVRAPSGDWGAPTTLDDGVGPKLAGPQAVLGKNDTVHLAYYGMDGTVWYRRFQPDGTLTSAQQLASGLGATRAEFGSVLPLVFNAQKNTVVVIYRMPDGKLWERRIVNDGLPTPPVRVTDRNVVLQAVDSQQPGADAVLDGDTLHVLFIEDSSRSIFSTSDQGGWQPSSRQVDNIQGSWVRGNIYTRRDGKKVYGFVYDAGSDGGAGMNRFGEVPLTER